MRCTVVTPIPPHNFGIACARVANRDLTPSLLFLSVGSQCFRDAFLISGCCNIVSLLAALLLSYRTRRNVPLYDVNAALDEVAPTQPLLIQQSQ